MTLILNFAQIPIVLIRSSQKYNKNKMLSVQTVKFNIVSNAYILHIKTDNVIHHRLEFLKKISNINNVKNVRELYKKIRAVIT